MSVTAAELLVKVGWDDSEVERGAVNTEGKLGKLGGVLGTAVAGVGMAAVGVGAASVKSFMTMQDAMVPIGTLLGTNTEGFNALKDGIKGMVASSPDSPEELGSAAYMILSAGISDTELALKALQDATDLAGAGLGTTAEATDLITSAMNSFKNENLNSQKAAETFFGTIASGKTTTSDLAQGFGQIAPLAASAGVGFTDLMAATAALTSTGQSASTAYAGIKGALSGIIKPTADAQKAADELGISFNQQHLAAVGLPAFLDEIKNATGGNVDQMARLFGSVEGLNSVLALTGPQAETFAGNLTNIGEAGAKMAERAAETDETVSARFATMKNKVMVVLADLGEKGFGALFNLWDRFGPTVMNFVNQVVDGMKLFVGTFTGAGADVDGMSKGMMNSIIDFAITAHDIFHTKIVPAFNTLRDVAQTVIGFIVENWPAISSILSEVWEVIKSILELWWAAWSTTIENISEMWNRWGDETMAVVQRVFEILAPLVEGALKVVSGIIKTITNLIQGDWGEAWDSFKGIFSSAWFGIKDAISAAFAGLPGLVWDGLQALGGLISSGMEAIVDYIRGLPGRIGSIAVGMFDGIVDAFRDAINWIIGGWNNLEFSMPEFDTKIPGVGTVGGWTIGTPNIPYLAMGGTIAKSGWTVVGERGPEPVWLPQGAQVRPNGSDAPMSIGSVTVHMPIGSNGEDVVRALKKFQRTNGPIPISVRG